MFPTFLQGGSRVAQRPCLICKRLTRNPSRCDACPVTDRERRRGNSTQRGYGSRWSRLSKAVLAEHRSYYGDWCPGWRIDGHISNDLTVDHIIAKASGGTDDRANLAVLCRACNGRKGSRSE